MAIKWNDQYILGIKIIDEQHKDFVMALIELTDIVSQPPLKKDATVLIFDRISDYSKFHFATEEKYFDEFDYEGAREHKAKHQSFVQKFTSIKEQHLSNSIQASFDLADYLQDWLVDHFENFDRKYIDCFHKHGLY